MNYTVQDLEKQVQTTIFMIKAHGKDKKNAIISTMGALMVASGWEMSDVFRARKQVEEALK
jgi:hypothetical protein